MLEGFFIHSDKNFSANDYWLDLREFNIQLFSQKEVFKDCLRKLLRTLINNNKIKMIVFTTTSYNNFRDYQLYAIDSIIRDLIDEINALNPNNKIEFSYVRQKADDLYDLYPIEADYNALGIIGISMHHKTIENLDKAMQKGKSKKIKLCIINMEETNLKDINEKSTIPDEFYLANIIISKTEKCEEYNIALNENIDPQPKEENCPLKKNNYRNSIKCILSCIKMMILNYRFRPDEIVKFLDAMAVSGTIAAYIGWNLSVLLDEKDISNALIISVVISIIIFILITFLYVSLKQYIFKANDTR
ncbi:MAG: hypothetical protein MPEBLZ_00642 [Candidatus Methanoperedens nitroreducens]|uniref:Uncharacterized protein n=2 Tax=Candidatus Methanoperedens TaxID=1392997 RepID=A0A0P8AD51_9EURY|nr:MAG: hypothetical protein MPEBLZ_00642 [Candidatus Methanoperedens sp. BLZ1]